MYKITACSSPVGEITLASDGAALTGLWLEGQKYFGGRAPGELKPGREDLPVFQAARAWLEGYFAGEHPGPGDFPLPLRPAGSPFQQAVWERLCQIPYGTVTTYGALAQGLGGVSPRAVGNAVGRNPISILIPCHRVVGAGGSLTGYAGGLERKLWLLQHEGVDAGAYTVPKTGAAR